MSSFHVYIRLKCYYAMYAMYISVSVVYDKDIVLQKLLFVSKMQTE